MTGPTPTSQAPGSQVTPVILTFNEAPNIGRTLESLTWARDVVVLDSGSTDDTERIARGFANVRWFVRPFDMHKAQWDYAIRATGVRSTYVLALDADYHVPEAFVRELETFVAGSYAGGVAGFEYRIDGRRLLGSVYPAKIVIFRPESTDVSQPGHTQEIAVNGPLYRFSAKLVHDDRKPIDRFIASQMEYARLEAIRLAGTGPWRWQDRLRRLGVMPLVSGVAAYFKAGGPFAGRAALQYAYQRIVFENFLALRVLEGRDEPEPRLTPAQSPERISDVDV